MVPITHEQNIICSKTRLNITTHEQIIICRQLFAGHVVGSRPMERKEKINRMIIKFILSCLPSFFLHLLDNRNKLREYWLPRITDKLTMIGSQSAKRSL